MVAPLFDSDYYTHLEIDGVRIANITPTAFRADFVDGKLHCQFTLNVQQNVNQSLRLWFLDSSAYDYFTINQANFSVSDPQFTCQVQEAQPVNGLEIDQVFLDLTGGN